MAGTNVVDIEVTGNETVSDTLENVADAAENAAGDITRAMGDTEQAFDQTARASGRFGEALDTASGAGSQFSGGLGDIGGAMTAFSDLANASTQRTFAHQQALLEAEQAQRDYDAAVSEFGPKSLEAQKAQLALNMAQDAAEPPTKIEEWGANLELLSPIIMGVVGVTDLMLLANTALNASWIKQTATMVGSKVALGATTAATGVATAAQWAWNIAMNANPIGLIILAVMALVGVIIYIATKTTWFQQLWSMIWGVIGDPVKAFVGWLSSAWDAMVHGIGAAVTWVKNIIVAGFRFAIDFVVGYFKFIFSIPGRVISVFASIGNAISAPFRGAFNAIARAWNNTVGRLSFTIPDWVPGLGGRGFSMPKLPQFNVGGDIMRTGLAIVHAGERIQPAVGNGLGSSGGRGLSLQVPMGNDPRIAIAELAAWAINSGYLNLAVDNVPVVVAR